MKRNLSLLAAAAMIAVAMFASCAKDVTEPVMDASASPETRVGNPKVVMAYVETNDTNPLIGLSYTLTTNNNPVLDIENLFAANINADSDDLPSIHFNQELAPIMAQKAKYIEPLQNAGIKVCLTLLGNWQNVGVANLQNPAQFARLVAYVVYTYELDGINIDDEYAGYGSLPSGTCGAFIEALRAEFDNRGGNKLITLFRWQNYNANHVDAVAGGMLDYVDHGFFSPTTLDTNIDVAGVTANRYMPMAINIGSTTGINVNTVRGNAAQIRTRGYAGAMLFNLRTPSDVNAQPVLNAIARGFYNTTSTMVAAGANYYQDQTFIPGGHTITNADVPANF